MESTTETSCMFILHQKKDSAQESPERLRRSLRTLERNAAQRCTYDSGAVLNRCQHAHSLVAFSVSFTRNASWVGHVRSSSLLLGFR